MRYNPSNLLVRTFGVRTWCKWALKSDSPWLMWTRIPYSARIGLPVRQYVGEAAQKPNLPPRTETDGKKGKKNARNATEFLISVDLGKVWPPLTHDTSRWSWDFLLHDGPPYLAKFLWRVRAAPIPLVEEEDLEDDVDAT